jgi:hypothetical protein
MTTRILFAGCLALLAAVSVSGQTKVSGTLKCDKPEPRYSIEVGDRPGHMMVLEKQTCAWAEPMSLGSDKSKDGQSVATLDVTATRAVGGTFKATFADDGTTTTAVEGEYTLA